MRPTVTPEAVVLDFDTAGVGSRAVAFGLDLVGQAGVLIGVSLFGAAVAGDGARWVAVVAVVVAVFAALIGYPLLAEYLGKGRTPGKAAVGLRVVTVEGAPVGVRHAAIRAFVGLVDFWLLPVAVVATLSALVSPRGQRVGDMVAGTIVIREGRVGQFAGAVRFPVLAGHEQFVGSLDTSRLSADEYRVARSFLLRADQLSPAARAGIGSRLAAGLSSRVHTPVPDWMVPEHFVVAVVAAHQRTTAEPDRITRHTPTVARPPAPPPVPGPPPDGPPDGPGGGFAPPA